VKFFCPKKLFEFFWQNRRHDEDDEAATVERATYLSLPLVPSVFLILFQFPIFPSFSLSDSPISLPSLHYSSIMSFSFFLFSSPLLFFFLPFSLSLSLVIFCFNDEQKREPACGTKQLNLQKDSQK